MKHGVLSAARSFAAMEASARIPSGCDFRITVRAPGRLARSFVRWFSTPEDAALAAVAEEVGGAIADYEPAVEQTYEQGKRAYPRQLHPMHSTAAEAGWRYEQVRVQRRTMEQQAETICHQPMALRIEAAVWG